MSKGPNLSRRSLFLPGRNFQDRGNDALVNQQQQVIGNTSTTQLKEAEEIKFRLEQVLNENGGSMGFLQVINNHQREVSEIGLDINSLTKLVLSIKDHETSRRGFLSGMKILGYILLNASKIGKLLSLFKPKSAMLDMGKYGFAPVASEAEIISLGKRLNQMNYMFDKWCDYCPDSIGGVKEFIESGGYYLDSYSLSIIDKLDIMLYLRENPYAKTIPGRLLGISSEVEVSDFFKYSTIRINRIDELLDGLSHSRINLGNLYFNKNLKIKTREMAALHKDEVISYFHEQINHLRDMKYDYDLGDIYSFQSGKCLLIHKARNLKYFFKNELPLILGYEIPNIDYELLSWFDENYGIIILLLSDYCDNRNSLCKNSKFIRFVSDVIELWLPLEDLKISQEFYEKLIDQINFTDNEGNEWVPVRNKKMFGYWEMTSGGRSGGKEVRYHNEMI